MTFFPVSVDELKYDKNRIFTRLKLRADPNTNAYAESIFPYLVELLRENIELVLAYNITDNDLTIASPELSSCDMLAVCYCGATQKIVDCVDDLMAKSDFLEGYILNDLANEVVFNASRTAGWQISGEEMTAATANGNPTTFYTRSSAAMSEGWTEGGKGLNDPCPVGYRVPTAAEWQSLLAYVDGNAAKNQDSGDTYSRWYALNSGGTLIGPSTMFRKGDNGRIHYPGRSAAYCSSTLAGGKPLPMYDWKAGDATGEGTYYERKMTTAYGMRCVKE